MFQWKWRIRGSIVYGLIKICPFTASYFLLTFLHDKNKILGCFAPHRQPITYDIVCPLNHDAVVEMAKKKIAEPYSATHNNCCHAVIDSLKAGGFPIENYTNELGIPTPGTLFLKRNATFESFIFFGEDCTSVVMW